MATRKKPDAVATFADGSSMTAQELAVLERAELAELAEHENNLDDPEQDSGDRVAALLGVSGTSGISQVRVYKIVNAKSQFCANYTPDEFEEGNFEMIRQQFGAGSYKVYLYGNNPTTGKYGIRTHSPVEIADVKMPKAQALGTPTPGNDNAIAAVLAAMADRQARTDEMLMKILDKPQADPMAQFTQHLTLMTTIKDLFGGGQKSTIGEVVDAMKELRSAKDLIGGDDKEPDSIIGMGSKLIEAIGPMLAQRAQQQPQGGAVMPQVTLPHSMRAEAAPEGAQPAQTDPQPEPTEEEQMNLLAMTAYQGMLAKLTMMAKTNRDIEDAAEYIADELPDELIPALKDDGWFAALTMYAPLLKGHQPWLTEVRARALEFIAEDEAEQAAATQTAAPAPAPTPSPGA